jgi:hypothetical protein
MSSQVFLHVENVSVEQQKINPEVKSKYDSFQKEFTFLSTLTDEAYKELQSYDEDDEAMYSINMSTMDRVFGFSSFTIVCLIALGIWEVYYLYSFFKQRVYFD